MSIVSRKHLYIAAMAVNVDSTPFLDGGDVMHQPSVTRTIQISEVLVIDIYVSTKFKNKRAEVSVVLYY